MAELSEKEIRRLIELYKEQENLYNHTLPAYHDREKARESVLYIATAMGRGWSEHVTKMRLKWLRNGYTRNRSAVENGLTNRYSTDGVFHIKWKWYPLLDAFLRPYCKVMIKTPATVISRKLAEAAVELSAKVAEDSTASHDPEFSQLQEDTDPEDELHPAGCERDILSIIHRNDAPSLPSPPAVPPSPSPTHDRLTRSPSPVTVPAPRDVPRWERKRRHSGQEYSLLQDMADQVRENAQGRKRAREERAKTDNEKFCVFLASQLDRLSKVGQIKARKMINDVLFEISLEEAEKELDN